MQKKIDLRDVFGYGGYIADDTKLMQSASGGVATAIAEHTIKIGGYVAGVAYSPDFYNAQYIIANDISTINKFKGSKYIDCDKKNIYNEVKKLIENDEIVVFFGLPCVVASLYSFLGYRPEKLITCELICSGTTYTKVHYDYVRYLEKKHKSKVVEFSVRYKTDESPRMHLYARFDNGKVFKKPFYQTEYGYAFSVLSKQSCYNCKFKGNNRQGDIMIGDFWGASESDEFWNKKGMSAILAETEKGRIFIESLKNIKIFPATIERIVENNPMVIEARKVSSKREDFERLLDRKGLFYAFNHTISFKERLQVKGKKIFPSFVTKVFFKLKKIFCVNKKS